MNALRTVLAFAFTFAGASAGVIRVDAAGSADFTNLQAAIDASVAGDILLVQPGNYVPFGETMTVSGKGITITSDSPYAKFQVQGRVRIHAVPAGQTAILRNAHVWGASTTPEPGPAIHVTQCAGGVLVEDCIAHGLNGYGTGTNVKPGQAGVRVDSSAKCSIVRTTAAGGIGISACGCGPLSNIASAGGSGLDVIGSTVSVHDSFFVAGKGGGPGFQISGAPDGYGALITLGTVSFAGCTMQGTFAPSLLVNMPVATIPVLDTAFTGESGGWFVAPPGTVQILPGTARHFAVSSPVREQAPAAFLLDGEPGDLAILFLGFGIDAIPLSGAIGMLQTSLPLQGPFVLGTLPAPDGVLSFGIPAPDLVVPGLLGFSSILQPFLVAGAEAYAAPPSSFVLVDSSL